MGGYYSEADMDRFREDAQAEIARLAPKPIKSLPGEFNLAEMFDAVEIDGEAYISLSQHVDSLERSLKVSTERDSLKAERDEARAQIAAAYGAAAEAVLEWSLYSINKDPKENDVALSIRALTPDDAAASLNQMLNEAYKAGQRDMRERAAQEADDWFYNPAPDETETYLGEKILNLPIKERNE